MLLTLSETTTKDALPWVKRVSETLLSLYENSDSTLVERLFLLIPLMKTTLGAKMFELQKTVQCRKLYYNRS